MPAGTTGRVHLNQLPGCAERFAAAEGHGAAVEASLQDLKGTVEATRKERREDHKELVGKLDGFILDHENRVTTVEESTKSAHHRVDTLKAILQWAGGIAVTTGLAVGGWLAAKGGP